MLRLADNVYAARMASLIYLDWTQWEAYKLGLLTNHGDIRRPPETPKEKASWTFFHNLAANLKRLIEAVPGGKTKIGKLIALYAMYRESADDQALLEGFDASEWVGESQKLTEDYSLPEFKTYSQL